MTETHPPKLRTDNGDEMVAHLIVHVEYLLKVVDDSYGAFWQDTTSLAQVQDLLVSMTEVIEELIAQAQANHSAKRKMRGALRFSKGEIRFPYVVKLDEWPSAKELQQLRVWCADHCGHDKYDWMSVSDKSIEFHFRDERMMTLFLLYWQGEFITC